MGQMEQFRAILHNALVQQRKEPKERLLLISLCVCVGTFEGMGMYTYVSFPRA